MKSKYVLVRNVRQDIDLAELESIFAVFGVIKQCVFSVGDDVTVLNSNPITTTGAIVPTLTVRTALVEYPAVGTAMECAKTMNGFLLGGQTLLVETVDEPTAVKNFQKSAPLVSSSPALPSTTSGAATSTSATATNSCVVMLENMVPPEEAADPQLKREVGEEGQRFGPLDDVEVYIDRQRVVVVVLTYAQPESARKAYEAMNGRYFGGRLITARLP